MIKEQLLQEQLKKIITKVEINLPHGSVDEILLSKKIYRQKNWQSRLLHFDEIASGLFIDLFTQVLQKSEIESVKIFLFNNNQVNYTTTTKVNNRTIEDIFLLNNMGEILNNDMDRIAEVIASSIIITNKDLNFVVIIDSEREFYYFYGDESFIKDISPFTFDEYKSYYDNLCDFAKDNLEYLKVEYLKWFWGTYINDREIHSIV